MLKAFLFCFSLVWHFGLATDYIPAIGFAPNDQGQIVFVLSSTLTFAVTFEAVRDGDFIFGMHSQSRRDVTKLRFSSKAAKIVVYRYNRGKPLYFVARRMYYFVVIRLLHKTTTCHFRSKFAMVSELQNRKCSTLVLQLAAFGCRNIENMHLHHIFTKEVSLALLVLIFSLWASAMWPLTACNDRAPVQNPDTISDSASSEHQLHSKAKISLHVIFLTNKILSRKDSPILVVSRFHLWFSSLHFSILFCSLLDHLRGKFY